MSEKDVEGRIHLLIPYEYRMACGRKVGEHWGSALNVEAVNCDDCLKTLKAPADRPTETEISDRRQRAREAFWDGAADQSSIGNGHPFLKALGNCVEVATQIKLTPEIVEAAIRAGQGTHMDIEKALVAAFAAAGFEVIE